MISDSYRLRRELSRAVEPSNECFLRFATGNLQLATHEILYISVQIVLFCFPIPAPVGLTNPAAVSDLPIRNECYLVMVP